ncbi:oligosaccharide repeat unit polymerase, partial [Streptococcus thermophilus]|nr:oligosaccharide repeat unit polymerase [Streptococcus thermophilus]
RLYNLREYSIKSIEVIVLGMIFFSLGVFCTRIVSHEFLKKQNNVINYDDNLNVNWTFLKILLIVVTTGNVFSIIFSLKFLLGGGSYLELRNMILGYNGAEPLITNPLVNILTRYISGPGLTALIPFSIFFLIRKKNIKFSLIILLNLVLATLSSGGRILLVYTIIQLFIGLSYSKKNIPKKIK